MKKNILILVSVVLLAVFLDFVFSGRLILPQFFTIGPLKIHYYGIIMAAAVFAGYLLAQKRAAQYGVEVKTADDLIFGLVVGGFIGARLYHVLSSIGYYWQHPIDILKIWNGGLSIYGAILGGLIVVLVLAKSYKLKATSLLDWLAPSVLFGQIIGRFGNLFNYEAFGYPTNLPWKMFVPLNFRPENLSHYLYFHPLFLYEAIGNAIILFILLKFFRNSRPGALFFLYLLLYNVLRFFLEFLRTDSTFICGLRLNSVASFTLVVVSVTALFAIHKVKNAKIS